MARSNALLTLVEDGADPQSVLPRLKELEAERSHLQDEGKGARSDVIELHPGIADHYRTIVRDLRAALAERSPERKLEVVASVRSLVEKIVIYPNNDPQSRDLELVGQLAALLSTEDPRNCMRRVVAEECYHERPRHQLIPVTAVRVIVRIAIAVIIVAAIRIKPSTKATALEATVAEATVAETAVAHREPAASETATAKAVTSAAKTTAMASAATTASPCERGCAGRRCRYAEHDGRSCCNHLLAHCSKLLMFHSIMDSLSTTAVLVLL